MKQVILSADGDRKVYAVPDEVADHLEAYCLEFCTKWLLTSPHAKKYRRKGGLCYNEEDFIHYLNSWLFPTEPCFFVENLGPLDENAALPKSYAHCPSFNF